MRGQVIELVQVKLPAQAEQGRRVIYRCGWGETILSVFKEKFHDGETEMFGVFIEKGGAMAKKKKRKRPGY